LELESQLALQTTPATEQTQLSQLSFEQALLEIETIIKQLEHPNTSLENSIALYKEGVLLTDYCNKLMENFKGEILILQGDSDDPYLDEFEIELLDGYF